MKKELKRMRYFDGLFLNAEDYKTDQEYQRRLSQIHNRYLHTWGIMAGLDVTIDEGNMKVKVGEGLAINQVLAEESEESISQMILVNETQSLDLSGYKPSDNIYITLSYEEVQTDLDNAEKAKGEAIHILERGKISHSKEKPNDPKKDIILAKIIPNKRSTSSEGLSVNEAFIDDRCILRDAIDIDKTPIRTYAGPAGKTMSLEKLIIREGEDIVGMPYMKALNEGESGVGIEINSPKTNFSGHVVVGGDLVIRGELTAGSGMNQSELKITNNFVQVNSRVEYSTEEATEGQKDRGTVVNDWKLQDGGLEVYRGGAEGAGIDARIVWSENEKKWKAGIGTHVWDIAYGPIWERLIKNDFVDDLHKHNCLSYAGGVALKVENSGSVSLNSDLSMNDKTIWLRTAGDINHGLGWFGEGKPFAGVNIDGPVLFGYSGGILGTTDKEQKSVLSWNSLGNVGIGIVNPTNDKLEVGGSLRILSGSNPVRFTSQWTSFPDAVTNQAEICNDTTYHKALMLVGNKSAGQGRKVAVWDRLDVNGFLYVNGNMQVLQALTPSAGNGNNGIIFPSDPGGGGGDAAWMKYYPRNGESCTLEIGTSNDGDDNISLMSSGNVGIGTLNPSDKLDVNGWMRIMSGSNPIRFTSQWTGFPDGATNQAEICNDTTYHKSLMIVGNNSAGQGRKVSIWDRLDVNGLLNVNGNLQISSAIVPSVGSGENNGIVFPKDPYGGSGDSAWIKYYSDTSRGGGENMTLEIGISDNTRYHGHYLDWSKYEGYHWHCYEGGDRIRLHASGGVYVDGYFYYSSSKDYKENISGLSSQKAKEVLDGLNPVTFNFKGDTQKTTMGFIAEDVHKDVAANDQKAISPMEIIAVLTGVVKDQRKALTKLQKQVDAMQ